ncbi:hypothetical protein Ndes2437A_g03127 [Nannochloris sp. 'desiccata']
MRTYGMGSHVSDNDPEVIEKAKERHLKGKTKSHFPEEAPGWDEALASDSEAVVKAERSNPKSIKEMQDQTVECLHDEMEEESDKVGKSSEPNS